MSHRFGPRTRLTGNAFGSGLVSAWLRRSTVKSIQNGIIVIGAASTSNTAAITAVRLADSLLVYVGWAADPTAVTILEDNCLLTFTSSTVITASHDTAGQNLAAGFQVIEYWPGIIRSVQRGTIVIANGTASNTATITTVNTTKSIVTFLGTTFTAIAAVDERARLTLTNSTTVTANRVGTTDTVTIGYQVVEYW